VEYDVNKQYHENLKRASGEPFGAEIGMEGKPISAAIESPELQKKKLHPSDTLETTVGQVCNMIHKADLQMDGKKAVLQAEVEELKEKLAEAEKQVQYRVREEPTEVP